MADQTWNALAHKVLDDDNKEPIKADTTQLAKFGAPAVGIVTALLTGILGTAWNLDPSKQPSVVIAAAIIVAAAVLGIYFAFASDIQGRSDATRARIDAIMSLAQEEAHLEADSLRNKLAEAVKAQQQAEGAQQQLEKDKQAAEKQAADSERRCTSVQAELTNLKNAREVVAVLVDGRYG